MFGSKTTDPADTCDKHITCINSQAAIWQYCFEARPTLLSLTVTDVGGDIRVHWLDNRAALQSVLECVSHAGAY